MPEHLPTLTSILIQQPVGLAYATPYCTEVLTA